MIALLLLCLSLLLQILAAIFALRLISISKGKRAWIFIAVALVIRSVRLCVPIYLALFEDIHLSVVEEGVGLVVSLLLALGVFSIRPLFTSLMEAQKAAEDANIAKDEFLANISHEIRTPLTIILSSTEIAMKNPEAAQELLQMSMNAGESLQEMVEDLLDLSSARRGHIKIVENLLPLHETVGKVGDLLKARAVSKRLSLDIYIAPDVPAWVIGDAKRIKQILINLVANAIKFTESGGVRVDVKPVEGISGGSVPIEFSVTDTGIGIPKEKQKEIFNPFFQIDTAIRPSQEGAGLGLALSKTIIERMGGHIWVESKKGSTFSFTLPLRLAARTPK